MRKLLLLLVAVLICVPSLFAQEETEERHFFYLSTATNNEYADENGDVWYLLPDRYNRYLYDSGNNTLLTKVSLDVNNLNAFLWKLVDTGTGTFQIVSKSGNKVAYTASNLSSTILARNFYLSRNSTNTFDYTPNERYYSLSRPTVTLRCVESNRYFYSEDNLTFFGRAIPAEDAPEEDWVMFDFNTAIFAKLVENHSFPYTVKSSSDSESYWYQFRLPSSGKDSNGNTIYYCVQDNGANVLPTGEPLDMTNDGQLWKFISRNNGEYTIMSKKGNILTFDASIDSATVEQRKQVFAVKAPSAASLPESALLFIGKTDTTGVVSCNATSRYRFLSHNMNEQNVIMAHDSVASALTILDLSSVQIKALNPFSTSQYVISTYLRFGGVKKATTSEVKNLRITKYLTGDLSYTLTGDDAAAFTVTAGNYTAENGGILDVTFAPTKEGVHKAVLTFKSAGAEDVSITITGVGTPNEGASIPGIDPADDPIVETIYFNLQGQRLTAPVYGINIVEMKHESGRTSSAKIFYQQK